MSLNNCTFQGRICNDLQLEKTTSGVSVLNFTIAVDRDYQSGEKQTDFIPVVAWRRTGEFISRYFSKGKLIIINGSLQVRKYTTQNGEKRSAFEIVADRAYFSGDKEKTAKTQNNAPYNTPSGFQELTDDSELPF